MENVSVPDPILAKTQMALQDIRDLPAALLKTTFDRIIPADRAPPATFWDPYNDEERNIGLVLCGPPLCVAYTSPPLFFWQNGMYI